MSDSVNRDELGTILTDLVRYVERAEVNGRPVHFIGDYKSRIESLIATECNAARIDAITHIMSAKTEGLFDDGELFIKRAPIEQAVIDLVGYEDFKAIQDSMKPLQSQQPPIQGSEAA